METKDMAPPTAPTEIEELKSSAALWAYRAGLAQGREGLLLKAIEVARATLEECDNLFTQKNPVGFEEMSKIAAKLSAKNRDIRTDEEETIIMSMDMWYNVRAALAMLETLDENNGGTK